MDAPREIFALDIGTWKIAGILMEQRGDRYYIHAAAVEEQAPGAMVDGQIHDVTQVARTIAIVRDRLAHSTGKELTEVAVAAAGRSLVTADGSIQRSLLRSEPITREIVAALELGGRRCSRTAIDPGLPAGRLPLRRVSCTGIPARWAAIG